MSRITTRTARRVAVNYHLEQLDTYRAARTAYESMRRLPGEGDVAFMRRCDEAREVMRLAMLPLCASLDNADQADRAERAKKAGMGAETIAGTGVLAGLLSAANAAE